MVGTSDSTTGLLFALYLINDTGAVSSRSGWRNRDDEINDRP
jgi:hypothetical protein